MTLQFDPNPGPPWCGWGKRKTAWWDWLWWLILAVGALVLIRNWGR